MRRLVGIAILVIVGLAIPFSGGTVVGAETTDSLQSTTVIASDTSVQASTAGDPIGSSPRATSDNDLTRQLTFDRIPGEPGTVAVEMAFELPDQVVELETGVPRNATVTGTDGFDPAGDGNYSWDGETVRPTVSLALEVNRTGAYLLKPTNEGLASDTDRGLTFVDTGEWTIASVPTAAVYWSAYSDSPRVNFVSETAVAGEGVAGERMVFLGTHTKLTRDIDGQTVTLVVPDAADLTAEPTGVLDSFSAASPHLPASPVRSSVVIAAPTTVEWGPYGLADRSDTWVRADEPLDVPDNVWLHEFVHLRQDFRSETDARWIREGMPEYYAALLTLEQGHIDFGAFSDHLERATRSEYADTVLSEPDTWASLGNYVKGALAYGTIDRRIREESAGTYAARNLFEAMNERNSPIDQSFIEAEIASLTDTATVEDLRPYMSTSDTPSMWTRTEHQTAFGTDPPAITISVDDPIELSGPYRNRSVDTIPRVVPGERLSFRVTITNDGEATGPYDVSLTVDEVPVANATGTLAGGETTTVSLDYTIEETGALSLAIGSESWSVTATEPATPVISALRVSDDTVKPGTNITVVATFENPETWPANGSISATLDETRIATWRLALADGEITNRTVVIAPVEPGDHQLTVGSKQVTVRVQSPEPTTATTAPETTDTRDGTPTSVSTGESTATDTPGFNIGVALFAFVVLSGFVAGRRS